jgi:hypothetical protein
MEKEITKSQIAKIWACAHDIGLDNQLLYLLVPRGSIRGMTQAEASELIEHLIELGARRVGPRTETERTGAPGADIERAGAARSTTATPEQRQFIHFLLGRLGWLQQPERTRGFLLKYAGTPTVEGIGEKARASAIIEALKAMWKRQRKADPR